MQSEIGKKIRNYIFEYQTDVEKRRRRKTNGERNFDCGEIFRIGTVAIIEKIIKETKRQDKIQKTKKKKCRVNNRERRLMCIGHRQYCK